MLNFIKKHFYRKNQKDELNKYRTAKRPSFKTIIIGDGVTNYDKIKCLKCGNISDQFVDKYSAFYNAFIPSCKFCGADIMSNAFIPLDKNNKEIHLIHRI